MYEQKHFGQFIEEVMDAHNFDWFVTLHYFPGRMAKSADACLQLWLKEIQAKPDSGPGVTDYLYLEEYRRDGKTLFHVLIADWNGFQDAWEWRWKEISGGWACTRELDDRIKGFIGHFVMRAGCVLYVKNFCCLWSKGDGMRGAESGERSSSNLEREGMLRNIRVIDSEAEWEHIAGVIGKIPWTWFLTLEYPRETSPEYPTHDPEKVFRAWVDEINSEREQPVIHVTITVRRKHGILIHVLFCEIPRRKRLHWRRRWCELSSGTARDIGVCPGIGELVRHFSFKLRCKVELWGNVYSCARWTGEPNSAVDLPEEI